MHALYRREFFEVVAGAAAWPLAARAATMPVIGFLSSTSPAEYAPYTTAFHQGLGSVGFVEKQNVAIDYRWAQGRYDQLPTLAADLVHRQVDVIAAIGGVPSTLAAKAATATIPIVFTMADDPIRLGLVASISRPGGNITGVTFLSVELEAKKLELLHELLPAANTIAALVNPKNAQAESQVENWHAAARALGWRILVLNASAEGDFDSAFATLLQQRADALLVGADAFLNSRREQVVALAARHGVSAIYPYRESAAAGGLMSYGTSLTAAYREAGVYTGRILKGEKPGDLPVQQSTNVELVINQKTARALRVVIPPSLLARADEVIE